MHVIFRRLHLLQIYYCERSFRRVSDIVLLKTICNSFDNVRYISATVFANVIEIIKTAVKMSVELLLSTTDNLVVSKTLTDEK